jgi:hypothetical protein
VPHFVKPYCLSKTPCKIGVTITVGIGLALPIESIFVGNPVIFATIPVEAIRACVPFCGQSISISPEVSNEYKLD